MHFCFFLWEKKCILYEEKETSLFHEESTHWSFSLWEFSKGVLLVTREYEYEHTQKQLTYEYACLCVWIFTHFFTKEGKGGPSLLWSFYSFEFLSIGLSLFRTLPFLGRPRRFTTPNSRDLIVGWMKNSIRGRYAFQRYLKGGVFVSIG